MMSEICVNKIINDFESEAKYIVLWVAPGNEFGYWYDLSSRSRKPEKFIVTDILAYVAVGRYETQEFVPSQLIQTEASLTDSERQHRDRLWGMMKPAVESEPDIYDGNRRKMLLRVIVAENNISLSYLYKLLDKYWRSGKMKNIFVPRYSNSGARGKVRQAYHNDGERRTKDAHAGKTLSESDRNHFQSAINKYYLTRNKLSLTVVYEKLLQDFYSIKTSENQLELKLLPPNRRPTFRQFEYWYYKNRNIITEQKKRESESTFELTGRGVLGKSDFGLMGPGAQFQIDATVGDIYLVSQFDRSNLIGRPVLYFVLDAFSRMVTGMSVGLEGPSWSGMACAIANMATDKIAYCREYGIEITEAEWPCRHLPSSLVGDRGELISKNADNLANMLGVRVANAPPFRADLKGIVEQQFRIMNINSIALLPGSVKPDISKRGGHDYRLDAILDIRELTQIVVKCILHYNNSHYMDYFERSEAMIRDHVPAIPIKLWEWGIRNCSGALRSFPEEQVRLAVMPTDRATVTAQGIRFKGLFYSSDRAVREAWFEKARSKKTWQVTISYDPRDMAAIYVWNKDEAIHDACWLLDWNGKNAGKCLDEIIFEQRLEKIVAKQLKESEIESKVNLNAEIDAIVAEAAVMSKGLPQKSKKDRVSKIKENRRNEQDAMRLKDNPIIDGEGAGAVRMNSCQETQENKDLDPILQMIRGKVEERLKK